MTESTPDPAGLSEVRDLGPLTLTQEGEHWCFTITAPSEIMLELPPNYERFLTERLERLTSASRDLQVEMDLAEAPALSSRQLGLMLALHKALADYCDRLPLVRVSPGVRRLLDLTRTIQFFELG